MKLTVVILAAGLGRRFGGLKQIEGLGPNGATLLEYGVYDAISAGFERVVCVIRESMFELCQATFAQRFGHRVRVEFAFQRNDDVPGPGDARARSTPWGTGHAVLASRALVAGPFVVMNADDFYGAAAFANLARSLRQAPETHAMVAYRLGDTLSPTGGVSRAICTASPTGFLQDLRETHGLYGVGEPPVEVYDEHGTSFTLDQPVSMNIWGFGHSIYEEMARSFSTFLNDPTRSDDDEFLLPDVVRSVIRANGQVRVLPGGGDWIGVTHAGDRDAATLALEQLIERGDYPRELWS
jgi:hypothetical protein